MDEGLKFGEEAAKSLGLGDIVEWSKWNPQKETWDLYYGLITSIKNEIRSNRLISVSKVLPLNGRIQEIEFFTLSLRLVSPSKREELSNEFNS
tara:strand:+ start:440 stop:718 length:279 start_codon:yes stop_codon:yes gene_type:complete